MQRFVKSWLPPIPQTHKRGSPGFDGKKVKVPSKSALGRTRTPNLLILSQMLYPLSYKRNTLNSKKPTDL